MKEWEWFSQSQVFSKILNWLSQSGTFTFSQKQLIYYKPSLEQTRLVVTCYNISVGCL
jgi:hypothetical protein